MGRTLSPCGWLDFTIGGCFPEVFEYFEPSKIKQGYKLSRPAREDEFGLVLRTSRNWWKVLIYRKGEVYMTSCSNAFQVGRYLYMYVMRYFDSAEWLRRNGVWQKYIRGR